MIKIAFVNFDMSTRGGGQQVLCNIANALAAETSDLDEFMYEIHVISLIHEKGECAYSLDQRIHYYNILPGKRRIRDVVMRAGKEFRAYCAEHGIQLLFYVAVYAGFCGGFLGRRLNVPKVFCDHGSIMSQWDEWKARLMRTIGSRYSDQTVVLTKQSEKAYYEKFSYNPGRVITIYNWMDESILDNVMPYDADSHRILTAGRFSKEKGMDLLVDTAVCLKEKTENFVWDVYGDGDLFDEIRVRVQHEGLAEHVRLHGLTDEMEKCYRGHAMYVLTSYREGLPLVLLEAKANHLPLVSFDIVSGPAEIITDGKDGILVSPYDTERMAACIYELLENRQKREAFSAQSGLNIHNFSKEKILSQWKSLIAELTHLNE